MERERIEKQVTDFINGQRSYTRRFIYDNEDILFELISKIIS